MPLSDFQDYYQHCFDCSGAPASTWLLLGLFYVCFLLDHTNFCAAINCVPLQHATPGSTYNISPLLWFHFWELVYYQVDDSNFPSNFL